MFKGDGEACVFAGEAFYIGYCSVYHLDGLVVFEETAGFVTEIGWLNTYVQSQSISSLNPAG